MVNLNWYKMEKEKQYYMINEKGEYYVGHDFNGKASFLPAKQDGNIPVTTYIRGEWEITNKKKYLEKWGSGFKTLELKEYEEPIQIQQGNSGVSES